MGENLRGADSTPPPGLDRVKGSDHCYIGDLGKIPGWSKTHLTGCIGEIMSFHRSPTDIETLYIHQYLIEKWF